MMGLWSRLFSKRGSSSSNLSHVGANGMVLDGPHRPPPKGPPGDGFVEVGPYRRVGLDNIINLMAGAGTPYDKTTATQWAWQTTEDYMSLTNMFNVSWLAKKIVRAQNDDMMRNGILLDWDGHDKKGKDTDAVKRALNRWKFPSLIRDALYDKSLYGGSVIVIGNGNAPLTEPLPIKDGNVDYSSVKNGSLRYLKEFSRWRAMYSGEIDSDIESPNAGKGSFHMLSNGADMFVGQKVHWTRVIRFDAGWTPWDTWRGNAMWNNSELQSTISVLKTYDTITKAIAHLIFRTNIDVVKAEHLIENLTSDPDAINARYLVTQQQMSMFRLLILDKDAEEFESHAYQFGGLANIWEKISLDVSGACGIPVTRLFGQAPAGLNATGDADMHNYYDNVAAVRKSDVTPPLEQLVEVIIRNELGYLPDGLEVSYPPLWQPTASEKAQMEVNRAGRDKIYVEMGVLSPGRVAAELKEDGVFRTMEQEDVDLAMELSEPADEPTPPPMPLPGQPGAPVPAPGAPVGQPAAPSPGQPPAAPGAQGGPPDDDEDDEGEGE